MSDWEFIEVEREGRVGIIRFNRPDRMNAVGPELGSEVYYALEEFNADPDIGAIVTTGNGRAYSSGADLSARVSGDWESTTRRPTNVSPWTPEFLALECKPLIAAVNGIALGVGLTSLLWYDQIVASTQARFSMRFAAIALTPEVSSAWMLPRIIGYHNAKEMMLTGKIYSAEEALGLGLINKLVEPDQLLPEAVALGQEIAAEVHYNLCLRIASMQDAGRVPNYEASMGKVFGTELTQRIARTTANSFGLYSNLWDEDDPRAPMSARGARSYVFSVPMTIAGGTSEIQRNIIATRGLGLLRT